VLQLLGPYYGLDYIAAVTAAAGMYLLGNKNPIGFLLYGASSLSMIVFAFLARSPPILFANAVALVVTLRGARKWRHSASNST
jgi:hypothetical protein